MKKFFRFAMSAAAAVLALVSCQRSELAEVFSGPKTKITVGVKPDEIVESTRTFLEEDATGAYHSKWSNSGEALGLFLGDRTAASRPFVLTAEPTDDNDPVFTGEFSIEDGTYKMFIFYPSSAFFECDDEGAVGVDLKEVQTPDLGTFDPSCDLMGWSTDRVVVENGSLVLENIPLLRPMAILRLVLNSDDDAIAKDMTVTGVRMEVEEGASANDNVILTGRPYLNNLGQITGWGTASSSVEAVIDESSLITVGEVDFNEVFLVVNAATVPAGRKITFSVEGKNVAGDEIKFERTVSKDEEDMTFQAGKINSIGLKLRDKDLVGASTDYYVKVKSLSDLIAGDYLIVYEGDFQHASVAFDGGLQALDAVENTIEVTIEDEKIAASDELDAAVFTIDPNGTVLSKSGKYIGVTANSNGLGASEDSGTYANTFDFDADGNAVIKADFDGSTMTLRYNYASNQLRFRYYKSGQSPIALYAAYYNVEDPTPRVVFAEEQNGYVYKTVPASATSVEFTFSKNKYVTELPTVTKYSGLDCFDGDPVVTDNKVTVPILASQETTPRYLVLKVTGQGIDENGIILEITQEAYEAPEVLTMASLNSKIRTDNKTGKSDALEYSGEISDLIVTEKQGDYCFAEDATGGILLYQVSGLEEGMKMSGQATFKAYMYSGMPDVISFTAPATVTTGAEIPSQIFTSIADLTADWDAKMSMRIILKNVEVTQAFSSRNAKVKDSAGNELTVRDYANAGLSLTVGQIVNLTGYPAQYNTTKQFAVLKSSDIELSPDVASLSVNPTSLTWGPLEYGSGNAKDVSISINPGASGYSISSGNSKWTVSDNGSGTVTIYPNQANTSTTDDEVFTLTVTHKDEPTLTSEVTCTQAKDSFLSVADLLTGGPKTYAGTLGYELVYAVSDKNVILGDTSGKMLLFISNHGLAVGDLVTVVNPVTTVYQEILEITGGTVTKVGGDNPIDHGTPADLNDAAVASSTYTTFTASGYHPALFISMSGSQSGRNITGSNPNTTLYLNTANTTYDGKKVNVTGYVYSWSSSHSNYNFQLVSIEEDTTTPRLSVNPTSLTWNADEYGVSSAKEFTLTINPASAGFHIDHMYDWNIEAVNVSTGLYKVWPKAENTSTTDAKTETITFTHVSDENVTASITLTQNKVGSSSFTPFNVWEDDFSTCSQSGTALSSLSGSSTGFTGSYSGISTTYPMDGAIRIGKASGAGSITTPVLSGISGSSVNLTVTFKGAGWNGKTAKLTLSASKGTVTEGQTQITSESTMAGQTPSMTGSSYTFHVTGADNTTAITFATTNSIGIDDLVITQTSE